MTGPGAFVFAGGGTGGHVVPALAVAEALRRRGHKPLFIGTAAGMEAKLVPAAGFPIEWIEIGALNRVSLGRRLKTLAQLPLGVSTALGLLRRHSTRAVFSMGGYVSGPVMLASLLAQLPILIMEPNVIPGLANRRMGRFVHKALVNFEATMPYFPAGRAEVTGMPVRQEFFTLPPRRPMEDGRLNILITGGSQGAHTLNQAMREAWPLLKSCMLPVCLVHQTGPKEYETLRQDFAGTGLMGEVVPFLSDMPAAFARADLIISRSGASTVSEIAAAWKASVLVPFPFAADDHQLHNAEALARAGAARLILNKECTGERLFQVISALVADPETLLTLGSKAQGFARPGAAERAASLLEECAVS